MRVALGHACARPSRVRSARPALSAPRARTGVEKRVAHARKRLLVQQQRGVGPAGHVPWGQRAVKWNQETRGTATTNCNALGNVQVGATHVVQALHQVEALFQVPATQDAAWSERASERDGELTRGESRKTSQTRGERSNEQLKRTPLRLWKRAGRNLRPRVGGLNGHLADQPPSPRTAQLPGAAPAALSEQRCTLRATRGAPTSGSAPTRRCIRSAQRGELLPTTRHPHQRSHICLAVSALARPLARSPNHSHTPSKEVPTLCLA